jgi:hypothetical protein
MIMKKLLAILITICFLVGCQCSVEMGSDASTKTPAKLEGGRFCRECHDYRSGFNDDYDCAYTDNVNCEKCHESDICERGNIWKERELSKAKKKTIKKKRKRK